MRVWIVTLSTGRRAAVPAATSAEARRIVTARYPRDRCPSVTETREQFAVKPDDTLGDVYRRAAAACQVANEELRAGVPAR